MDFISDLRAPATIIRELVLMVIYVTTMGEIGM